jgi:hypothetical protein
MGAIHLTKSKEKCILSETILEGKRWKNQEKILQKYLAKYPYLLQGPNDMPLILVACEVQLDSGDVDIFLVNNQGLPVLVEVKLKKNPQSSREVIGQIIEYVSSITLLKFDELNSRVDHRLEKVLREISNNETDYKIKREYFERKLENQEFRLILAVDALKNVLLRSWLYESAHTTNDVRLVEIKHYSINDKEDLLFSNHLISQTSHLVCNPRASRRCLLDVVEWYNQQIATLGYFAEYRGPSNHAIFIQNWPNDIHYEFNDWIEDNQISVEIELNLKNKQLIGLKDIIRSFKDSININSCGRIKWCPRYKNWARLAFFFQADYHPSVISLAMKNLIQQTEKQLTNEIESILIHGTP